MISRRTYRRTWQQHILNVVGLILRVTIVVQGANVGRRLPPRPDKIKPQADLTKLVTRPRFQRVTAPNNRY